MAKKSSAGAEAGLPGGFDPPSSNVTWCPNQFFDVVLPHFPRGVVRLVGYLLWQTLAWNDAQGQPRRARHRLTWRALGTRAGISRGALGEALRAAQAGRFLQIDAGEVGPSPTATFELRWADGPYVRRPDAFAGFFRGTGHRTYVPNQFFTVVVAREPLAVVRVVGAVIRESIGFEAEQGYRRTEAALSCRALARRTRLSVRHVTLALRQAIEAGYLQQLSAGTFGAEFAAARYALRWSDGVGGEDDPIERERPRAGGRAAATDRGSKRSTGSVQKGAQVRFKKVYSSKEEIKHLNETLAKPAPIPPALPCTGRRPVNEPAAGDRVPIEDRLREVGFSGRSIEALARFSRERIERQIAWLADRAATRSPLGLLRRAIEEDWPPPRTVLRRAAPTVRVALPAPAAVPTEPTPIQRRAYATWMREQLQDLQRAEPSRYQAFLAHRERLKASLRYVHRDRPDHGILRTWDSEPALIAHLQAFDRSLPDLEAWCRRERAVAPVAAPQDFISSETAPAMRAAQISR